MRKSEFRTALRLDLYDLDPDSLKYSDDSLDRAVERALSDIDRVMPQEKVYEATLLFTVAAESFTVVTKGLVLTLANKPVKPASETVIQGTVTFTRDTDYLMDYSNGTITPLTDGGMSPGVYTLSYTKDELSVDLSGLVGVVRVNRVEYPLGQVPQKMVSWEEFGDILRVTSPREGVSQARLTAGEHIGIYYQAINSRPSDDSDGSLPDFMDEILIKGGLYYSLLAKVLEHLQASSDSMGSAEIDMTAATAALTLAATALTSVDGYLDDAKDDFDQIDTHIDKGDEALDLIPAVTTLIEAAITEVGTPAAGVMHEIDDIANDCLVAYSKMVDMINWSHERLNVGDDLINAVNVGANAAENHRTYAEVEAVLGRLYSEQQQVYLGIADRHNLEMTTSLQKAVQRLGRITAYINEAGVRAQMAGVFSTTGNNRLSMAQVKVTEAQAQIQRAQILSQHATTNSEMSTREMELATRYREESVSRRDEYLTVLRDRSQWKQEIRTAARRQVRAS